MELYKAEDRIKQKYVDTVQNMSHQELKKFNKSKYKELVLAELKQLVPEADETQLTETAQCVSNALDREAKSQLQKDARDSTVSRKASAMLSKIVIAELDNTLLVDATQFPVVSQLLLHEAVNSARDDDAADTDFNGYDIAQDTQMENLDSERKSELNDSITLLKQLASNDDEILRHPQNVKSTPD